MILETEQSGKFYSFLEEGGGVKLNLVNILVG